MTVTGGPWREVEEIRRRHRAGARLSTQDVDALFDYLDQLSPRVEACEAQLRRLYGTVIAMENPEVVNRST